MSIAGSGPADPQAARELYRLRCAYYDLQLAPYDALRRLAVDRLQLEPGQVVLDVGCGTGMSLGLLRERVGAQGRVTGVDFSPEMVELARQRVERHGWGNVELVCSGLQQARLPRHADAALFAFTHDILQTPADLDAVLSRLKPGARVSALGLKWAPPAFAALNPLVWWHALQSVTTLRGLDRPWALLAQRGIALEVEPLLGGALYVASGRLPGRRARR